MTSLRSLFLSVVLLLAACSSLPDVSVPDVTSVITPYRIDIRQGNFVSQEMVAQLKPGMTRDQVRFVLGTPLVTDIFHADRWDYVYRFQPGRGEVQQRRLTVYFEEGKLTRVAGDVVGSDTHDAAAVATSRSRIIEIVPAATGDKGEGVKEDAGAKPAEAGVEPASAQADRK
jgi:outer membrane protein assembly factor BamE